MVTPNRKLRKKYAGIPLQPLETLRLILTPLALGHLDRLIKVAGERTIADTTISVPHPLTESDARKWIQNAVSDFIEARGAHFAITVRPNRSELVGYIGIKAIDHEHGEGELSFWLDKCQQGKGYVTEAAASAVNFGFQSLHLNRICAYHMARNPASGRVLVKLGFTHEGRLRQRVKKWGAYEDALVWAKLATDVDSY